MGQSSSSNDLFDNFVSNDELIEEFELIEFKETINIKRAWVVKKTINIFGDDHAGRYLRHLNKDVKYFNSLLWVTAFQFYHWSLVMELSNGQVAITQYGAQGTSLKIFKEDNLLLNIRNAVQATWGEKFFTHSFCYLGEIEKENKMTFNELYKHLSEKKKGEEEYIAYNRLIYNCQNYVDELYEYIYNKKKFLFSFDIKTWKDFLNKFFPDEPKLPEYSEDYIRKRCKEIFPLDEEKRDKEIKEMLQKFADDIK